MVEVHQTYGASKLGSDLCRVVRAKRANHGGGHAYCGYSEHEGL
jgi:hypothetical protein